MADLITLAQYKEAEGISNPKDDLRLQAIIPSISELVKTYCGNSIIDYYSVAKEEYFNIDWNTHLVQLTESPVVAIQSIETRDSATSSYSTLSSSEYYLDIPTDSVFYVSGRGYKNWPKGAGAVKVTYTAGYSATPLDLKLAVIDLITYYFKREHKERKTLGGASIQNSATTSVSNSVAFPDHIKRVLDLYKNF